MTGICPRCEQDEVHEVRVRGVAASIFTCPECDATWLTAEAVSKDSFLDFGTWAKEQGVDDAWRHVDWISGRLAQERAGVVKRRAQISALLAAEWRGGETGEPSEFAAGIHRLDHFVGRKPSVRALANYLEALAQSKLTPPIDRTRAEHVASLLLQMDVQ